MSAPLRTGEPPVPSAVAFAGPFHYDFEFPETDSSCWSWHESAAASVQWRWEVEPGWPVQPLLSTASWVYD